MNANELRIGNLIEQGTVDAIHSHTQVPTIEVIINKGRSFVYLNLATPIPLTPEILEKCGFKKSDKDFNGLMDKYVLSLPVKGDNENEIFFCFSKVNDIKFGRYAVNDFHASSNFFSLHQLQNLYFALTGEELQLQNIELLT